MGRVANIKGEIVDCFDDPWEWKEATPVADGTVYLGWPARQRRGRGGCGSARWIVTPWLRDQYFAAPAHRGTLDILALDGLPFGINTVKKHRRILGIDKQSVIEKWWIERRDDLEKLSSGEFSRKHSRDAESYRLWRIKFGIDTRDREMLWWKEEGNAAILCSDTLPLTWIADHFGISAHYLDNLRYFLRKAGREFKDRRLD